MAECQEPRCNRQATKEWNGRRVCDDHYDSYRDEEEAKRNEFQN